MANTTFKVENGLIVVGAADVTGNTGIAGHLTVTGNTTIGGSLTVTGNLNYSGVSQGNLVPGSNGDDLGNTTNRWDGFFNNTVTYGQANPSSNTIPLGNTTARWVVTANTIATSGNVSVGGVLTVAANAVVNGTLTVNSSITANGSATVNGNISVSGNASITGALVAGSFSLLGGELSTNTKTVTSTSQIVIDSFPKDTRSMCKYFISIRDQTTIAHAIEILAIHDGTNVLVTQFAEIYNANCGVFDVNINNANVELSFVSSGASGGNNQTVNVIKLMQ